MLASHHQHHHHSRTTPLSFTRYPSQSGTSSPSQTIGLQKSFLDMLQQNLSHKRRHRVAHVFLNSYPSEMMLQRKALKARELAVGVPSFPAGVDETSSAGRDATDLPVAICGVAVILCRFLNVVVGPPARYA